MQYDARDKTFGSVIYHRKKHAEEESVYHLCYRCYDKVGSENQISYMPATEDQSGNENGEIYPLFVLTEVFSARTEQKASAHDLLRNAHTHHRDERKQKIRQGGSYVLFGSGVAHNKIYYNGNTNHEPVPEDTLEKIELKYAIDELEDLGFEGGLERTEYVPTDVDTYDVPYNIDWGSYIGGSDYVVIFNGKIVK